jgi:hypothetical protein
MKTSGTTASFRKTAACPASATLLSFRANSLSGEVAGLVKDHLKVCDFCSAELPLLAHHQPLTGADKIPEIPEGLRILAESILSRG